MQGASLAGMFLVNAVMLSTFLKALQMSGSTVATVINFASNFLLSVRCEGLLYEQTIKDPSLFALVQPF